MPDKWTSANVKVLPAPIAGQDSSARMLYQYYEKSPTKLDVHRQLTQAEKDALAEATWYNRIATGADTPKGK